MRSDCANEKSLRTMKPLLTFVLFTTGILHTAEPADHPPVPIRFHLDEPRAVTLVIEDESGNRVRNLIGAQEFQIGRAHV